MMLVKSSNTSSSSTNIAASQAKQRGNMLCRRALTQARDCNDTREEQQQHQQQQHRECSRPSQAAVSRQASVAGQVRDVALQPILWLSSTLSSEMRRLCAPR